jgi:uncharacterized protein
LFFAHEMKAKALKLKIINNAEENRFEVEAGGQISVLEYQLMNDRILFTHTEVPPELESQGIGSGLAHAAMEYARRGGLKVVAVCPFIQDYVEDHPEYASLLSK